jgi:hypothetical protein
MPNATERTVFVVCAFLAGALAWAPGERVSAIIIWSIGAVMLVVHLVARSRHRRAARAAAAPPAADPAVATAAAVAPQAETEGAAAEASAVAAGERAS